MLTVVLSSVLIGMPLGPPKQYSPNDANLYYSPFNWHITQSSAATINSAAYVRFLFSGTFLNFNFDVSQMVTPVSEIYWHVDNGACTHSLVLDSVAVAIPPNIKTRTSDKAAIA